MLEARQRTVYYSPRKNRHFMTPKAAAKAEANGRMNRWFPPESDEWDDARGYCTNPGWHWKSVPRLVEVHARLVRRYLASIKNHGKFTK